MTTPKLPLELESEILSRVPATSLKRWRSTCKTWYALFKDPRFIKTNKNLGKAATQMILKEDQSVYSFSFDFNRITKRFDQSIEFTGKLKSLKDSEDVSISEIFHCEGLLLCTTKDNRLVVWNPCTGQTRWIPSRPSSKLCKYSLGYGNDNKTCDNYKILRFDYCRNNQNALVASFGIYEFNSDSWRVLDVAPPQRRHILSTLGVSLKGNTYWFDHSEEEDTDLANFVLRFDFTTERFERLPLPFESDHYDEVIAILSVVREEKLALLRQMIDTDCVEIWVSNTKTDDDAKDFSWSKFLLADFGKLKIDCMRADMSFLVNEENKMVMCCEADDDDKHRAIKYIVGEDLHKPVYRESSKGSKLHSPLLVSYVPSLVQIPERQSNPGGK